jgi:CO/xanthine dehydrogenase Mo-binding subunit
MAQICAGTLGVDYRRVRVVSGQTDRIQYGKAASSPRRRFRGKSTTVRVVNGACMTTTLFI